MKPGFLSPKARAKLARVKLLIFDVDGILTNGRVFNTGPGGWSRVYHVKDGFGMRMIMKAGIHVAVISAGSSPEVLERMKFIGVPHVHMGSEDKVGAFEEVLRKTGCRAEEACFVADELFDIPVLNRVGFKATVPDAPPEVLKMVDYVTKTLGGDGAAREVIDLLRKVRKIPGPHEKVPNPFGFR